MKEPQLGGTTKTAPAPSEPLSLPAWQRALLDHSALSIIATDTAGIIQTCNAGALQWLGYEAGELVGTATPAIIHDPLEIAERAAVLSAEVGHTIEPGFEVFVAKARGGEADEQKWTYIRKDGSRFRVSLTVTAIFTEAGHLAGFMGIGRDITAKEEAERRLSESQARQAALLEAIPDLVFVQDEDHRYIDLHAPSAHRLLLPQDQIIGRLMSEIIPEPLCSQFEEMLAQAKETGQIQSTEYSLIINGEETWYETRIAATENGRYLSLVRDVTDRRRQEQALKDSEARFQAFMDNSPVLSYIKDQHGRLVFANKTLADRFQLDLAKDLGKTDHELWGPEVAAALQAQDRAVLAGGELVAAEESVRTPDGLSDTWLSFKFPLHDSAGQTFLAGMSVDITERKYYERQLEDYHRRLEEAIVNLEELASTDSLTGLRNRGAFAARLEEEIARSNRYGLPLSLLMIDVDRFKEFNDEFGHPAGDELLQQVAQLLSSRLRSRDFLARFGGEEFVVILPNTPPTGAYLVAERFRRALEGFRWKRRAITASFGAATLHEGLPTSGALLQAADSALYRAKQLGRNRVVQSSQAA